MNCLFCPKPLDGSDEHIILNAIGGRKSSTRIICSNCNNRLGSTIDDALLKALEPFTLIIDPPTRRQSIGARKRVLDAKGIEYEMTAGGKLKVRYKRIGDNQWIADASEQDRVMKSIDAAAKAMEQRTGQSATISMTGGSEIPAGISFPIIMDNETALRALLKWAIELLACEVLNTDELRAEVPTTERDFVNGGTAPPMAGFLERSLLPQMYEGLEHYVFLIQTPNGPVYWEASAYGGAIAMAGKTAPLKTRFVPVMYRVDPVTGNHSVEHPQGRIPDETCKWVPTFDTTCRQRTVVAGARMNQLMNGRQGIDQLIRECMQQHFPQQGVITEQHTNALSRCVAEKYTALMRKIDALNEYEA